MEGNEKVKVHLLFPLGEAWYEKDGELYLFSIDEDKPRLCRAGDIELLHDINPGSLEIKDLYEGNIREELRQGYRANTAWSFALDGLDSTLKKATREVVIKRANELCQDPKTREFVRDRLLGCPVPKEADVKGAIEIARQENALFLLGIFGKLSYKRAKKAFLDAASEDRTGILTFKEQHPDLELITVTSVDDPTETFNQLKRALDACDEVITFYNEAPLSWLTQRLRYYQRVQSKRKNNLIIHIRSSKPQPKDLKRLSPNAHWENWGLAA